MGMPDFLSQSAMNLACATLTQKTIPFRPAKSDTYFSNAMVTVLLRTVLLDIRSSSCDISSARFHFTLEKSVSSAVA